MHISRGTGVGDETLLEQRKKSGSLMWVWVKVKPPGTAGSSPCFHVPCTMVPFWVPICLFLAYSRVKIAPLLFFPTLRHAWSPRAAAGGCVRKLLRALAKMVCRNSALSSRRRTYLNPNRTSRRFYFNFWLDFLSYPTFNLPVFGFGSPCVGYCRSSPCGSPNDTCHECPGRENKKDM